ncbi:hypothetical protein [Pseudomonas putida]|uniref:hypothetical protein n=1 Tax=Pseudomonas putida TaxID=303 RepID=UPI002753FE61|nr:hypothetical protein [Pseudomonas putida]MDP9521743.1 hypothetical protein [Pseudomonas putida]
MNNKVPKLTQAMHALSLEEFLAEMEKGAKTLKWDALLVFDRGAANALLTQEYIDRIDIEDEFFPALPDGNIDVGNGIEHVLLGLVLDKPRLSFENASIQDSKSKLQMRLVGGKHIEVYEKYLDGKPVRSIAALSIYNAATRGLLDMNIRLEAVPGSVDHSGKVLLDLHNAFDHVFSGGGTEFEKQRLGIYFQEVFDAWSDRNERITQFPLSEMVVVEGSPLNPGVFGLRTHAAPGATVLGSEDYGNGAVVVFVAMRGSETGTYPHNDAAMLYMLPEAPQPYTSNLVLSQAFLAKQIQHSFEQFEWIRGKFDVVSLPDELYKLVANAAAPIFVEFDYSDNGHGGTLQPWSWRLRMDGAWPQIFGKGAELVFEGRSLKASWVSTVTVGTLVFWSQFGNGAGHTSELDVNAQLTVNARYKFAPAHMEGNKVLLKFVLDTSNINATVSVDYEFGDSDLSKDAERSSKVMVGQLEDTLKEAFRQRAEELMNMTFEIDALRLNNLLFRGENVVEPRDVAMPADLTLLGNLAPKRTTLVISPAEPIVASGEVIEFTADGATGGVTWKVENLPGETGETGAFNDPAKGRYTAPSDDALRAEGYRRLIVTATSGQSVSRALVSVVPSQVTVNPWVAVVNVGKSYALSASTPDSAPLRWDDPELGSVGPDYDPLNPDGYKYTAPAALPQPSDSDPLHYLALRLDPVTVRPAAGGAQATIDMLVVGNKNPNYWLEPEAKSDGSVALTFYRIVRGGGKVEVPEPVEWTVLRGSGSVDQDTRVYTPAPGADDQYVIISAFYDDLQSADTCDYVILPLPFVPVRRYADILNPAAKEL